MNIWDPIKVGHMKLEHRIAMAPMTRSRAEVDGTPGPMAAAYYSQRASMGLLITEGTQPSDDGQGYTNTPGIYTDAHVEGWKRVTSAVHAAGGYQFIQLMHVGRMAHPDNTPHHRQPIAPSAIAAGQKIFTPAGMQDMATPRALAKEEIKATVQDFRHAASRAIEAGADGVEIHGANGYLIQQFLSPNANLRTDEYGGSNRTRFAVEVVEAIVSEIGAERTALRLSPGSTLGGINEGAQTGAIYRELVAGLAPLQLAYLHLVQGTDENLLKDIRRLWPGTLLVNRPNRALEAIGADIESGLADMVSVARWALANPDFVKRLRTGAALNAADPTTFFAGGARGYIDYPALA
ncbi:MAG TPA: alkene reductase [Candidatus Paceibacterota bacterium]|nr:alkene reductase [Candidatus Paceibacterota bacterium]